MTATFLALDAVCGFSDTDAYRATIPDRETLAGYLASVESGRPFPGLGAGSAGDGVGLRGGGEDHVAVLCAVEGALVQYSFEPVRRERVVALPEGWTFAVASSGVVAEKTGAAQDGYNRLSDRATRAAQLWRSATGRDDPHITAALDAADGTREVCDAIRRQASAEGVEDGEAALLARRVEHVDAENQLVAVAAEVIAAADVAGFGEVTARSHRLAEAWLGNQVPETSALVRQAGQLGAMAASAFGAGFGGAVWAMVREEEASAFLEQWAAAYGAAFPKRRDGAEFFTTPPSGPARAET